MKKIIASVITLCLGVFLVYNFVLTDKDTQDEIEEIPEHYNLTHEELERLKPMIRVAQDISQYRTSNLTAEETYELESKYSHYYSEYMIGNRVMLDESVEGRYATFEKYGLYPVGSDVKEVSVSKIMEDTNQHYTSKGGKYLIHLQSIVNVDADEFSDFKSSYPSLVTFVVDKDFMFVELEEDYGVY